MNYTARIRALREDNDMTQMKIAQLLQVGHREAEISLQTYGIVRLMRPMRISHGSSFQEIL